MVLTCVMLASMSFSTEAAVNTLVRLGDDLAGLGVHKRREPEPLPYEYSRGTRRRVTFGILELAHVTRRDTAPLFDDHPARRYGSRTVAVSLTAQTLRHDCSATLING